MTRAVETVGNPAVRFSFDRDTGELCGITNRATGHECLAPSGGRTASGRAAGNPFGVYSDFARGFAITAPEGRTPSEADRPGDIAREVFTPAKAAARFARSKKNGTETLRVTYRAAGAPWAATLTVKMVGRSASSLWSLAVKNASAAPRELMTAFPLFTGLRLGSGRRNLMVVNDQAGYVLPLWAAGGGIYGKAERMSMPWGCVYDEESGDAFAFLIRDPALRNKQIRYAKPAIEVSYFPPVTLAPGEGVRFPEVEILVYEGDWKRAAVAYHAWFSRTFRPVKHAAWVRSIDGHSGGWFEKRGEAKPDRYPRVDIPLDHFRDLPALYRMMPVDNHEYAFHCSRSMDEAISGKPMMWMDGDYVIRPDLGGAEGLRQGIRGVHALGHHFTFYVEGYLCAGDADIVTKGRGRDWAVMNKDGTNRGSYTREGEKIGSGLLHMCTGAKGWQEHLAQTAARLVRETGADGVRLDSLGLYFYPCYNPLHGHASPFDYNVWLQEMLAAVAQAVRKENPDCLLTTEGGADFFCRYFDGALSQQWVRRRVAVTRGVSPMRIACPGYITLIHNPCGPVAASLTGLPGGSAGLLGSPARMAKLDRAWRSVRFAAADVLRWGDAAHDEPAASRRDVECRRFSSDSLEVIVGARPVWPPVSENGVAMNSNIDVKRGPASFTVSFAGRKGKPKAAYLYDVESLASKEIAVRSAKGVTEIPVRSSWFLAVLAYGKAVPLALMDLPRTVKPGTKLEVRITLLGARRGERFAAKLFAPVFAFGEARRVSAPGTVALEVPASTPPGYYVVELTGKGLLGFRRFVQVSQERP